jgi:hypothetical protein
MHGFPDFAYLRPAMTLVLIAIGEAMFLWPDWPANLGPYIVLSRSRIPLT